MLQLCSAKKKIGVTTRRDKFILILRSIMRNYCSNAVYGQLTKTKVFRSYNHVCDRVGAEESMLEARWKIHRRNKFNTLRSFDTKTIRGNNS